MSSFEFQKCGYLATKKTICTDNNVRSYPCNNCSKCKSGVSYNCNRCEKVFTLAWYLKRHQKLHENKKVWSCHVCNTPYKREDHYFKHICSHEDYVPDISIESLTNVNFEETSC